MVARAHGGSARLSSARIRLEGRLELVERATTELEDACRQLASPAPRGLERVVTSELAPEMMRAERSVPCLQDAGPEVAEVLRRLDRARTQLTQLVNERMGLLQLGERPLATALKAVEAEPLLDSRWLVPWRQSLSSALAVGASLTLGLGVLLTLVRPGVRWLWWFLVFLSVGLGARTARRGALRVVVTPQRILLGGESLWWRDFRASQVEGPLRASEGPYRLRLWTERGARVERWLPALPRNLAAALVRAGVSVEVRGSWPRRS